MAQGRRSPPMPPGAVGRPLVDIDMGIGREYGYRDIAGTVAVYPWVANMRSVRVATGATLRQVAAVVGVHFRTVSGWENRRRRTPVEVERRWAQVCVEAVRLGGGRS